ncbi:UNVERIFIED_ORG: hypothetical protein J2X79_000688 [Arthrobacter globiformis]|nr:hypothetical protein [Arthrobacter globiformis]
MGDNLLPGAYIYVIAAAGRQVTRFRKLFSDGMFSALKARRRRATVR